MNSDTDPDTGTAKTNVTIESKDAVDLSTVDSTDSKDNGDSVSTGPSGRKKPKNIWLISFITIFVIALGLTTYFILAPLIGLDKKPTPSKFADTTRFESTEKLVEQAKIGLQGGHVDVRVADGFGGKTADGLAVYPTAPYKAGDRSYKNLPETSNGVAYQSDSVIATSNYQAFTTFFKDNKFALVSSTKEGEGFLSWNGANIPYIASAVYESEQYVCMAWHGDASSTRIANHISSLGCAAKSDYETAAKTLDPLYAAYTRDDKTKAPNVVLANKESGDGLDGYKYAVLYQEDTSQIDVPFEGLYYKEPKKDWQYFFGGSEPITCADFNTEALKKAFNGINCIEDETSGKQSTVK